MAKAKVVITLGDCTGIGPEVAVKALADPDIRGLADYIIVGDKRVWDMGCEISGTTAPVVVFEKGESDKALNYQGPRLPLIDQRNVEITREEMGQILPKAGRATGEDFIFALDLVKKGKIEGIVYAPLHKAAMNDGGYHFRDELEFFVDELGFKGFASEINTIGTLWAARVASHVPITMVPGLCTYERVLNAIRLADRTLRDAGYENPRIGMNALNPHCGDNGLCGNEEIISIIPAIKAAQEEGIDVSGPYSGDTVFLHAQKGELDVVIGTYHDQVQVGIKLLGFHQGVTINAGLPAVLVTPAHGTAFDIAGTGTASAGPMTHAIKIASRMAESRKNK